MHAVHDHERSNMTADDIDGAITAVAIMACLAGIGILATGQVVGISPLVIGIWVCVPQARSRAGRSMVFTE